tara:strand:+ start:1229 stop:1393 length:165 start_codon:yes stop_codon:yes gene_type:complete
MKGEIIKIVSIGYSSKEEKARAVEQFKLFGSTDKTKVFNMWEVFFDAKLKVKKK